LTINKKYALFPRNHRKLVRPEIMVFRSHPIGACCVRSVRLQGFIPQKLAHFEEHILTLHRARSLNCCSSKQHERLHTCSSFMKRLRRSKHSFYFERHTSPSVTHLTAFSQNLAFQNRVGHTPDCLVQGSVTIAFV
jgi:hypothetical protein